MKMASLKLRFWAHQLIVWDGERFRIAKQFITPVKGDSLKEGVRKKKNVLNFGKVEKEGEVVL